MDKPKITTNVFFFPDPFGTGQSVSVEAESMEEALKQLEQRKQEPADAPQEAESERTE